MRIKNVLLVGGYSILVIGLAGCTVRTYSLTRDRIDQDLSGNRGYLTGNAPAPTEERKTQRTTQVVELEFGPKAKPCPAAKKEITPEAVNVAPVSASEIKPSEPTPTPVVSEKMQEYKVKKGDTLQKISKKFYRTSKKWLKIYNANTDKLRGPDKIYPGQTINIPIEEEKLKEPKENLK